MPRPYTLYMDETGNRHPDKKTDASREGRDWFGFGGYLLRGEDSDAARSLVNNFSKEWKLKHPLHMTDMIAERKGFSWLGKVTQTRKEEFWNGWRRVLCEANIIGLSCVIDRPGYVARGYLQKHNDRWLLCRSAFDITVERAAKIAKSEGRKLHVVFEQDAAINQIIEGYFDNLKANGLAFDGQNSRKYVPLSQTQFAEILGRIQHKPKSHPLLQIADSYIYAMARHGYDKKFWIHRSLRDRKRLSDFVINSEELPNVGIKYYCFD